VISHNSLVSWVITPRTSLFRERPNPPEPISRKQSMPRAAMSTLRPNVREPLQFNREENSGELRSARRAKQERRRAYFDATKLTGPPCS
jgi:hypothetical protein